MLKVKTLLKSIPLLQFHVISVLQVLFHIYYNPGKVTIFMPGTKLRDKCNISCFLVVFGTY